jgi:hypothetical protein
LQDIGRVGQGPLEFQIPYPLHVDADGSVHVFDSGNRRESVIRPDLTLMAESQLPAPVFGASPIPGSHDYVVSSWIPRPGMVGHPLHRLSEGEVALSFGAPTDARELVTPMVARLALDADSDGHVFSAHEFSYDVTVWTQDGRRILGLVGPILNEHDILPGHFNTENPPPARISAIRYEGPDRLWVVRWQLRSDWEDRIFEAVQPDGRIRFEMRNGASLYSLYVGEIDIIDLDNGLLMASSRVAPLLAAFVGPDRMISLEELSDGTPQLAVWEVSLKEEAVR